MTGADHNRGLDVALVLQLFGVLELRQAEAPDAKRGRVIELLRPLRDQLAHGGANADIDAAIHEVLATLSPDSGSLNDLVLYLTRIEAASLGTSTARAVRRSTSPETIAAVLARAAALTRTEPTQTPEAGSVVVFRPEHDDAPAAAVFGIDLGATSSTIAYVDADGHPTVVRNEIGEETTPSVIYFDSPYQVVVGKDAKNAAIRDPHLVAQLVKRDMGRLGVEYQFQGLTYTPEAVSALILRHLSNFAEANTGLAAQKVVLAVPANFGISERSATRLAAEIAGLSVLDMLPEPIAAVLHYEAKRDLPKDRTVLICDLGGSTYEATVAQTRDGNIQVLYSDGDLELGGIDWDVRLCEHMLAAFREQHPQLDPSADDQFMQNLMITAEDLKKHLSYMEKRQIILRFGDATAQVEMTRQTLEELTSDLLDQVVAITERASAAAKRLGVTELDGVLLVGGMARVPALRRRLRQLLDTPLTCREPELAVAKGTALYAALRQAESITQMANELDISPTSVASVVSSRVTAVVPRALGVLAVDPADPLALTNPLAAKVFVRHLLQANTPLPAHSGPHTFLTMVDNQDTMEIEIWEQSSFEKSPELVHNILIGSAQLRGIPPRKAGSPVEITFSLSAAGTLTVRASEPDSLTKFEFELVIGGPAALGVATARDDMARLELLGKRRP